MFKLDKLKQAEQLYVNEKQPLDVIGTKLDISHRTKEYDWDKKRFKKDKELTQTEHEYLVSVIIN